MICFINVINIIIVPILIKKKSLIRFKKLNERTKLHNSFKNWDQIKT